jgi:hypothetical protein
MRRPFTTCDAIAQGHSYEHIRWQVRTGRWQRVLRSVYLSGCEPPSEMEMALSRLVASNGVAVASLAALLHGLDGVKLGGTVACVERARRSRMPGVGRRQHMRFEVVDGYRCTDTTQTLVDLAAAVADDVWEQALESALRLGKTDIADVLELAQGTRGVIRIRRVLGRRPVDAPATESLLETLAVQLIRRAGLPDPVRQLEIIGSGNRLVARVDLAWPNRGLFLELDGKHHHNQLEHDARRETAIVAATGWIPGRFTWREITTLERTTARRLRELYALGSPATREPKVG